MRLFLLTLLTMVAFAANSVLNRAALADGAAGPASFAALRLVSGAVALWLMVRLSGGGLTWNGPRRRIGTASLALYMLGFSFAYVSIEAGPGALILFGGVQITMFIGALALGERIPLLRYLGAGVAFAGLMVLLWPAGGAAPDLVGSLLMLAAALGWGAYSLAGRGAKAPLADTAANFVLAAPIGLVAALLVQDNMTATGAALAITSGVVTSGMGYALWYAVLPRLDASLAAVAQLSVPVIAMLGGILFLGEMLSLRFVLAAALVAGGVLLSLSARSAPAGRS